jgi:hypothetical protein
MPAQWHSPAPQKNNMMRSASTLRSISQLVLGTALSAMVHCGAFAADDDSTQNSYMAGAAVNVDRPVPGDLIAAAGRLQVAQPVSGDAVLAAGSVAIKSPVSDDLRAAGGIVTLSSRIGGETMIAAGRATLTPAAETYGRTWLAGGKVVMAGRAYSGMNILAREVIVLGEVDGPLEISGERIEIGSSARLHGGVTYSSGRAIVVHPRAQIEGAVTRVPSAYDMPHALLDTPALQFLRPLLMIGLMIAGVLLYACFPQHVSSAVASLRAAPARSAGLGLAVLLGVPPVVVLLVITIIGIPIALALGAGYALALLVGYLIASFCIGDALRRAMAVLTRRNLRATGFTRSIAFFAIGVVLLNLASNIPYIGSVVLVLALIAGLGGVLIEPFTRFRRPQVPAPGEVSPVT